jgi:xanthine dehydrogenase accessory factor
LQFWNKIAQLINEGQQAMLLYVFTNEGSSPGKQGFKMAVVDNGVMLGSIGGGMMEQKLVELAKTYLKSPEAFIPFVKRQIHSKDVKGDQSGMICSGEQVVGFYKLSANERSLITTIATAKTGVLTMSEAGIEFQPTHALAHTIFEQSSENQWLYQEDLRSKHIAHIIGAGHVGWALSRTLHQLGFYVHIYDDRQDLYTLDNNEHAHEKHIVDYRAIANHLVLDQYNYVVIVSFGYRADKLVLKQLIHNNYSFLGMMGSEFKVQQIKGELLEEGVKQADLDQVHAPIGILKHSHTPEEIAVSIAAQLIEVRNGVG